MAFANRPVRGLDLARHREIHDRATDAATDLFQTHLSGFGGDE